MTRLLAIPMLTACLTLGGCGSVLFNDNFDADASGGLPSLTPPGDPVGDSIYLADITGSTAFIVDGTRAGDKALRYTRRSDFSLERDLGFLSKEISRHERAFTASWTGNAAIFRSEHPLHIWLGAPDQSAIAQISIRNGRVFRKTGFDSYVNIGALPTGPHSVIWTVDRVERTYDLLISSRSDDTIVVRDEQVLRGPANPWVYTPRPSLWLLFTGNGSSSSTYTIDDIRIAETDSEM